MSNKLARRSFGESYLCAKPWPADCFVQCGSHGIVVDKGSLEKMMESSNPIKELAENTAYTTAFFEAFPRDATCKTFIRGEGKTVEEAEAAAYEKYVKYKACDHPQFERREYRNGAGFCVKCGMFKYAFEPLEICCICGKYTYYSSDIEGKWYCKECVTHMPEDKKHKWQKDIEKRHEVSA